MSGQTAPRRLLFLVTEDWYFCSHRLALAVAAREAGYAVTVVTQVGRHGERIRDAGLDLVPVRFPRSARHPLADLTLLARLPGIYARVRPHIAHHVALKPVLYGAPAAARARVPVTVNALAGLGYTFVSSHGRARLLRRALAPLLRTALRRRGAWTVLQNADDADGLCAAGLVARPRWRLVPGAGVDLDAYRATPQRAGPPVVLLAARMLWDKGVGEFVEAARLLATRGVRARFVLAGDTDTENPSGVPLARLREWTRAGVVEWLGRRDDMPELMAGAHVVCLPSYREGMPKVLLEAAASARPCVATDVPGCRAAVRDGETGLLVPARDTGALAEALARLITDGELRARMGTAARRLAETEFSVARVVAETLALYDDALRTASLR